MYTFLQRPPLLKGYSYTNSKLCFMALVKWLCFISKPLYYMYKDNLIMSINHIKDANFTINDYINLITGKIFYYVAISCLNMFFLAWRVNLGEWQGQCPHVIGCKNSMLNHTWPNQAENRLWWTKYSWFCNSFLHAMLNAKEIN